MLRKQEAENVSAQLTAECNRLRREKQLSGQAGRSWSRSGSGSAIAGREVSRDASREASAGRWGSDRSSPGFSRGSRDSREPRDSRNSPRDARGQRQQGQTYPSGRSGQPTQPYKPYQPQAQRPRSTQSSVLESPRRRGQPPAASVPSGFASGYASGVSGVSRASPATSPRRPSIARQSSSLGHPDFLAHYDPRRYMDEIDEEYGLTRMVNEADRVREAARSRDASGISSRASSRAGSRNASRF